MENIAAASSAEESVPHSRYTMIRCVIAIAHADGIMHDAEIAYIESFILRMPFSQEQENQLERDIDHPQDVMSLFREINDPVIRGQVLYFCRLMAFKDGVKDPSEDDILKKLHAEIMDGVDMDAIRQETQETINKEMILHDIEMAENRPRRGNHMIPWMCLFDQLMLKLGIDLMK
mgnify:CR=1 FL=1